MKPQSASAREKASTKRNASPDTILAHPNLKGALVFGSSGVVGAAQAVKDAGKKDQIAVIGTCSPSQARKLINGGSFARLHLESLGSGKSDRPTGEDGD
jgi:ABC-type sugar transport system substrate-binding protein